MELKIPIEPQPKLRPKFTVRHGRVHALTPMKTRIFESKIADFFRESGNESFEAGKPLNVVLGFYITPPKSTTKKKLKLMLDRVLRPTVKPDLDNYVKAVLDDLNGQAFHDDAQIVSISAFKFYDTEPHITILIEEV